MTSAFGLTPGPLGADVLYERSLVQFRAITCGAFTSASSGKSRAPNWLMVANSPAIPETRIQLALFFNQDLKMLHFSPTKKPYGYHGLDIALANGRSAQVDLV